MRHFDSERLIIPIGVLAKTPEALADIDGLNLTEELTPFLVDEDNHNASLHFASLARMHTCLWRVSPVGN